MDIHEKLFRSGAPMGTWQKGEGMNPCLKRWYSYDLFCTWNQSFRPSEDDVFCVKSGWHIWQTRQDALLPCSTVWLNPRWIHGHHQKQHTAQHSSLKKAHSTAKTPNEIEWTLIMTSSKSILFMYATIPNSQSIHVCFQCFPGQKKSRYPPWS